MRGPIGGPDCASAAAKLLSGPAGEDLIAAATRMAADGVAAPNALQRLAATYADLPAPLATAAAQLSWHMASELKRAVAKLGDLGKTILFDGDGLQMASSAATAAYHASIMAQCGATRIVDVTAGIGVDAIAFAQTGIRVDAYEIDPTRFEFLAANASRAGVSDRLRTNCSDGFAAVIDSDSVVFIDPPRRTATGRWGNSGEATMMLQRILDAGPAGVLAKMSPVYGVGALIGRGAAAEFLSHDRECKEALVRFGSVRGTGPSRCAVLVGSGDRFEPNDDAGADIAGRRLEDADGCFLYEPDPAVVCAGLVAGLCNSLNLSRLGNGLDYLVATEPVDTPFADRYRIVASLPFHVKHVQRELDRRGAGRLIVKKRGVSDDPAAVRALFKLRGDAEATLIVTRQGRAKWALLVEPVASGHCG